MLARSGGAVWRPFEKTLFALLAFAGAFSIILLLLTIVYSPPYPVSWNHPIDVMDTVANVLHRGGWSYQNVQLRYASTIGGLAAIILAIVAVERRVHYVCYGALMLAFSIVHLGATGIDGRDVSRERQTGICSMPNMMCPAQPYVAIVVFDSVCFAIYAAIGIIMIIFRHGPPPKRGSVRDGSVVPGAVGAGAGAGAHAHEPGCCGGAPAEHGGHPHDRCCGGKAGGHEHAKAPAPAHAHAHAPAPAPAAKAKTPAQPGEHRGMACCPCCGPRAPRPAAAKAPASAPAPAPTPAAKAPTPAPAPAPAVKAPAAAPAAAGVNSQEEARLALKNMKPLLGIVAKDSDEGVIITQVLPGKPGDVGGLRMNDVIVKVAHLRVDNHQEFQKALLEVFPGEVTDMEIIRDGAPRTMKVQYGAQDHTMEEVLSLRARAGEAWVKEMEASARRY